MIPEIVNRCITGEIKENTLKVGAEEMKDFYAEKHVGWQSVMRLKQNVHIFLKKPADTDKTSSILWDTSKYQNPLEMDKMFPYKIFKSAQGIMSK